MAKDLTTYGPIDIPCLKAKAGNGKHIERSHVDEFWSKKEASELEAKQGCYIFALRAARGFKPWYVGKATKSFKQECFQPHKLGHYNKVLFEGRKGTPVMFFVAPKERLKKVGSKVCDEIETYLIQAAYVANSEIRNKQKAKTPDWTIAGVVRRNRGKVSAKAQQFRTMLGIK